MAATTTIPTAEYAVSDCVVTARWFQAKCSYIFLRAVKLMDRLWLKRSTYGFVLNEQSRRNHENSQVGVFGVTGLQTFRCVLE